MTDPTPCRSLRLRDKHIALLMTMIQQHERRMRQQGKTPEARACKRVMTGLPKHAPYEVSFFPHEWAIVSRALRPEGSNPAPGTLNSAAYSLYQRFSAAGFSRAVRFDDQGKRVPLKRFGKQPVSVILRRTEPE